ncbi:restriction endonuclease [Nocardia sp. NBC_01377]|uniref:restriction endonuclease n=1 Tax=Nocardia sp. NBC_01377 TaxID=2903595 RepID=UPI0038631C68
MHSSGERLPDYDFHTLSPTDFELLTRDLLREKIGVELEAFGQGPDGGVDLRARLRSRSPAGV